MFLLNRLAVLALVATGLLTGCGKKSTSAAPAGPADTKAEVTAIATKLRDGGKNAALKLKPTAAQIEKIAATPDDAKKLIAYTDAVYSTIPAGGISAKPGQTAIVIPDSLPGGYTRTASKFKPNVKIYGFKFVEPGKDLGMAYDGLINVDGTWVMIPKAWRAFGE